MFGFIKSLFGSRNNNVDSSMVPQQSKDAYFLDQDAASTFGDVNYMRSVRSIKRTYAKTFDSPGENSTIKKVSSMNSKFYGESETLAKPTFRAPSAAAQNTFSPPASVPAKTEENGAQRRQTDNSMDIFRKMAKDIRK